MWSIVQATICAATLGFISGVALANWLDVHDVLFPFRRFRSVVQRSSYWQLIQMTNEIDNELDARAKARMLDRMETGTHLNTENFFCIERNEIEDGPG